MQFIKCFTIFVILAVQYSFQFNSLYRVYTFKNDLSYGNRRLENYNSETTTLGPDSFLEGTEMSTNTYEEDVENVYKRSDDSLDYVNYLLDLGNKLNDESDQLFKKMPKKSEK